MHGAQSRANIRHIRRLLQGTRKEEMSAAAYMHKMKGFADAMAAAGALVSDDELVDHILTGLGSAYNSIAANYTVGDKAVSYSDFYSHVLSFEALQAQQVQAEGWSSSVNVVMRPNPVYPGGGTTYRPYGNDGQQGQGRNGGGNGGYGRQNGGGYGRQDGGGYGRNDVVYAVTTAATAAMTEVATAATAATAAMTEAAMVAATVDAMEAATAASAVIVLAASSAASGDMRRQTAATASTPTTSLHSSEAGTLPRPPTTTTPGSWIQERQIT